jgi:membrane dipeptidase
VIVVDAHQDIAYNALQYGRDYPRSAYATRRLEAESTLDFPGEPCNGLPDALLGRLGVIFATLFVEPNTSTFTPNKKFGYDTATEAYRHAIRQWDYYQRLAEAQAQIDLINTQADLDAVLATWADGTDLADHHIGLVLLMEGADPVLEPRQLEEWIERGVRVVGPAWSATRYAGGTGQPGPLTDLGRELLDVMADHNLILDLSHTTEQGYLEALDRYPGTVIASHSNPLKCFDNERNLSDLQITRLAEHGGVIGVVLYGRFINPNWYPGMPKQDTPFDTILDTIDYICQLTGSADHVGIGTDIDGGFGVNEIPDGIDTVTDLLKIGDGLRARGYDLADVERILSGNFLRVLRQTLPG